MVTNPFRTNSSSQSTVLNGRVPKGSWVAQAIAAASFFVAAKQDCNKCNKGAIVKSVWEHIKPFLGIFGVLIEDIVKAVGKALK